ncbi:MAG: aminoglycoside phosphotransferase family protein [bacterium]|nr:aminoglycoside phosphotransferase family protein [bacterium]
MRDLLAAAARVSADIALGTSETLEAQLRRALHGPLGMVRRIERLGEGSHTTRHLRAEVHLARGGQRSVFVKTPSPVPATRLVVEAAGLTASEVRFYRALAAGVPLRVPECLHARHDGTRFMLVLEDLTGSAELPASSDACTARQALMVIESLADLHAFGWGRPQRGTAGGWLLAQVDRERTLGAWLRLPLLRRGLELAGSQVEPRLAAGALRSARHHRMVYEKLTEPPHTLVHNDCHIGNLAFGAEDQPIFLDWQMVRAGQWARDVAYFCALALDSDDRRAGEGLLLDRYRRRLRAAGGPQLDPGEAREAYRRHAAYALEAVIVTLALEAAPRHVIDTWLARACAAVEDLQAYEALHLPT